MVDPSKAIIGTVPTIMGAGLVGQNLSYLRKKKKKAGSMIGLGVNNIVGTSLIQATAQAGSW